MDSFFEERVSSCVGCRPFPMRPSRTWSSTSCSRSFCSASAKPSAPTPSPSSCSTSTNELVARAAKGLEEEVEVGTRIPVGQGFAGRVAAERRTVTIDDVDHAGVLNPILREKGVKSLLGAPLIAGGRVLGVVHVGTLRPGRSHWTPRYSSSRPTGRRWRSTTVAPTRRSAVANRLRRLHGVTDVALTNLSTSALLDSSSSGCAKSSASTCAILLLDEQRNELVATAAAGLEEEVEAAVRIPVGRGFAGRVAADIRPVVVSDVDRADIYNPILREKGIKSLLGAPLLAGGRLLGVIHVGTLTPRTFTADEADLLQNAAERAALGLERDGLRAADRARPDPESLRAGRVARAAYPTAAVLGSALTLHARAGALAPDEEEALRTILAEQARRLATVVDQLLDLSGWRRGQSRSGAARSVRDLVERTLVELSPDERIEVDVDPELEVDADPGHVERIVSNLVADALRRGAPPIVVTAGRTDGELELVEDGGAGVPEDVRARLFDEFVRSAESATTWQRSRPRHRAVVCARPGRRPAPRPSGRPRRTLSLRPARGGSRGVGPQSVSELLLAFPVIDRRSRPPGT